MNFARQTHTFNRVAFNKEHSVTVIGVGAGGSHLVYNLAKMGVESMHVYDFDVVEERNIPNQLYTPDDVGKLKVNALQDRLGSYRLCNTIIAHNERYTAEHAKAETSTVVYLAVDTMSARAEIFDELQRNKNVKYVIDGRMGGDSIRVYFIPMYSTRKVKLYIETLYTDEEAEKSMCGTSVSVGATANMLASFKAWQVIRIQRDSDDVDWYEMFFDCERMVAVTF